MIVRDVVPGAKDGDDGSIGVKGPLKAETGLENSRWVPWVGGSVVLIEAGQSMPCRRD